MDEGYLDVGRAEELFFAVIRRALVDYQHPAHRTEVETWLDQGAGEGWRRLTETWQGGAR